MLKGIDVSEHQGVIDWNEVKDHVDFVMLRAGYGKNNIDKQFERNIKECNRLGIPVGIYWFSYALNEDMARQEAKYALAAVKNYRLEYPISFDLEYDTLNYAKKNGVNIDKRLATNMVKAFCSEIEAAKYYAMNYTNQDFINNHFYFNEIERYCPWYAWYNKELDRSNVGMWQYSDKGTIPGIQGSSVDLDYARVDFAKDIKNRHLNNIDNSNPAPKPSQPSRPAGKLGVVTASVLNVRSGAGTGYKVIGQLKRGDKVQLDCLVGSWWSTYYGEHGGFVSKDYIRVSL
ncbi:glycosyl hydrolases 25 family protein [Clostridium baratii str. Sullivan]|uniref:Glycosyl hydrolases 25 family protein n=1 Tax=Clostridium baratii str. Sullivan TaxID=1415775 RepID=A0A0A7FTQ5_9CLOT|nr:GH25 family lysozyme [Clostridium baratii]AIY82997.1 glycosyl hydrolases 25 family protein [Clostridium baratii str. Sullivan]